MCTVQPALYQCACVLTECRAAKALYYGTGLARLDSFCGVACMSSTRALEGPFWCVAWLYVCAAFLNSSHLPLGDLYQGKNVQAIACPSTAISPVLPGHLQVPMGTGKVILHKVGYGKPPFQAHHPLDRDRGDGIDTEEKAAFYHRGP